MKKEDIVENDVNNIEIVMNEIKDLLIQKNRAYGSSFRSSGALAEACGATPMMGLFVRLEDKMKRITNLLQNPNISIGDESVEQTILDLVGYWVLALILVREGDKRGEE